MANKLIPLYREDELPEEYTGDYTIKENCTLPVADMVMTEDLVVDIAGYRYSEENSVAIFELIGEVEEAGTAIEINTEEGMAEILASATDDDIGTIYKFTGPTTENYIQNELYIIEAE